MKYHGYVIKKEYVDLGEEDKRLNYCYNIFDIWGRYINTALTLSTAKDYIDSGFNEIYL